MKSKLPLNFRLLTRYSFTVVLYAWLAIAATSSASTDDAEEPTLRFWLFDPYHPESAEETLHPFFKEFSRRHGIDTQFSASNNKQDIISACNTSSATQIIAVSLPLQKTMEEACGYQTLAYTFQEVFLYRQNLRSNLRVSDITRVGLINDTFASEIGRLKFPSSNTINYFNYNSAIELLAGIRADNIDAIVAPKGLFNRALSNSIGWTPMRRFKTRDVMLLMVHPSLDTKLAFAFESLIYSDRDWVFHPWQKKLGLGLFQRPERVKEHKLTLTKE